MLFHWRSLVFWGLKIFSRKERRNATNIIHPMKIDLQFRFKSVTIKYVGMSRLICMEEYEIAAESSNYPQIYDHPLDVRLLHRWIGDTDIRVLPLYSANISIKRRYRSPDRHLRGFSGGTSGGGQPGITTEVN